mmetsp:Transcript_8393/g.37829  ORF Transcript_8393/g.37829 Transcript_8393/m.37829 type:complete len:323 (-) Transcript_8393:789-1757(-)
MPRARSHYEVLGVSHDAPSDEVRKAYRRLALVLHPDKRAAGVTEDEAKDRFQRLVEAFKVVGDETARREYDESHASDIFAAEATAPTGGGVHDRDSWNDVIAKLNQRAKRAKKDLAKKDRAKAKAASASSSKPNPAEVGATLPCPNAPRPLGCLPEEIVLEVFGCVGVGRLVEVEARRRVHARAGSSMTVPDGDWVRVLRMTLGLAEVARLCVAKGLAPSTSYTFRTRCGVRTEDLGEEWRGEACSLVPEIFGPWSDESAMVKTAALSEKEVMRRRREEMRDEARAMAKKDRKGKKEKKSKKSKKEKKSRRDRSDSSSDSDS